MAKKNAPIITYTEILCRAIKSIDADAKELEGKAASVPAEIGKPWLEDEMAPLMAKRDALCNLYRIETGTDYI